jgi:hypothetical protein
MTVTIQNLEAVRKKIDNIERFRQWAAAPMIKTMSLIHDDIAQYKPKAKGAFSSMATQRQKRAYWARVRSGQINHSEGTGYVRTGTLGRKWTTETRPTADGVRGIIGNNAAYAPFVQSAQRQQPFHKATGFQTDEGAVNKTAAARQRVWRAAVAELLSKR